eukprot:gnl/TRDRNA2_/TRDRNA2_91100_c1_seq1.p1 gnl/TRDRNA2_/TRDRNA2_91100_c1~~gnl/TRDRNA2_/TRDRNA2_91100_c1_seq1.p1  ORF type:complete len:214 (+),score=13.80 gnl/TRDRNA2_/TRDRNA2_91100_c1_seq1:168-809(+)
MSSSWVASNSNGPNRGVVEMGILATAVHIVQAAVAWSGVLDLQPIAFVCYTVGQECYFGATFSWVSLRFGFDHFGTLMGLLLLMSGTICLSVNPIMAAAVSAGADGFRLVFLAHACAGVAAVGILLLLLMKTTGTPAGMHSAPSSTGDADILSVVARGPSEDLNKGAQSGERVPPLSSSDSTRCNGFLCNNFWAVLCGLPSPSRWSSDHRPVS